MGVPTRPDVPAGTTLDVFARFGTAEWITNSRNTADEHVVRTLASMAGFSPRLNHQADSLDLVQDMIAAGMGVGLLPMGHALLPGVRLLPLTSPDIELRSYAVARHGRLDWPPLALVTGLLATRAGRRAAPPGHDGDGVPAE
nr:LysR substrate-binding domain-containing protein [Streptomyces sp. Wb2n-11]